MKKVALTELDPRLQKQVGVAEQQLKTNPQYAMEILTGILVRNPGCIEVRRSLRRAQKTILGTKKGLFDGLVGSVLCDQIFKFLAKVFKCHSYIPSPKVEELAACNPYN